MIFHKYTKWIPLYNYDSLGDGHGSMHRLIQVRRNIKTGLIEFKTTLIEKSGCCKDLGINPLEQFKKIRGDD